MPESGLGRSLIPAVGSSSVNILAGCRVLSAVGACPLHDGVRRRWWINVASAVSLIESSQKIGPIPGTVMNRRTCASTCL
jgi:hypothetical protein